MKFFSVGAALLPLVSCIDFNPDDEASIRSATAKYARGLMSYYKNGASGTPQQDIGIFPDPHYWWEAGAAWGGMVEYSQFTDDSTYADTLVEALVANFGPNNDILLPWRKSQEGNDDQAFWAFAVMSALEYKFQSPQDSTPGYFEVVKNCFNNIAARWDTGSCNGGLKWQIYPENAYGYNYKNSISNGAFFALAARLAQYTGNQTYADWALKTWDWTKAVGLIGDSYQVFDGTDDKENCTDQDHTEWSYNVGVYLHGAAAMYNFTKGDNIWKERTSGLLNRAGIFFKPFDNATNVMFEAACETGETGRHCNLDQQSFKAYLARFMAKAAILAPFTKEKVTNYLRTSAVAAAESCSGGTDGVTCGSKWYVGGWDGTKGVGQQLSALEVTQALLMLKQGIAPSTGDEPTPSPSSSKALSSTSAKVPVSTVHSTVLSSALPTTSAASSFTTIPAPVASQASQVASSGAVPQASSGAQPVASSGAQPVASSGAQLVASSGASSAALSAASSAASSAVNPVPTSISEEVPNGGEQAKGGVCTCTPSSTVTVTVPPTGAPAPVPTSTPIAPPPSPPPTTPNSTVPVSPPANSTGPGIPEFTGAAAGVKVAGFSILGAVAVAMIGGIL